MAPVGRARAFDWHEWVTPPIPVTRTRPSRLLIPGLPPWSVAVPLMLAGGEGTGSLARDTVFAAVMIAATATAGLPPMQIVLLTLTLIIATFTPGSGRATVMQDAVHLVLFAAFLFPTLVP